MDLMKPLHRVRRRTAAPPQVQRCATTARTATPAPLQQLLDNGDLSADRPVIVYGVPGDGRTWALRQLVAAHPRTRELYYADPCLRRTGQQDEDRVGTPEWAADTIDGLITLVEGALQVVRARRARAESFAEADHPLLLVIQDLPVFLNGMTEDARRQLMHDLVFVAAAGPPVGCLLYITSPRMAWETSHLASHCQRVLLNSWPNPPKRIG